MSEEALWDALFYALFAMVIVLIPMGWRLERLLRERHPGILEALEEDDERSFWRGRGYALSRFIWRREYRALRDPKITRLAGRVRALGLAYTVGFATLFLWSLYDDVFGEAGVVQTATTVAAPGSWETRRDQAYALHNQGRHAEAIRIYDDLLGPVGTDGDLVYWRGMAHWKMGSENLALVDFRRVMDLKPGWFETYLYADRILSRQRRFDDCVDLWTRYLRVVPGDATAYMERGGSHFHRGDFAAAYADSQRACDLGKKEACIHAERMKARL